ncbi:hypothetical protein SK3146_05881 [Paenibacillus konkukensis]|uniref:SLH domain-containing protein n=1 Tax=Paenibacillus konkukensis TaxID=2020716 RepID=A0ABY4RX46_9BACL|nr:S-layer homology domain-containing protein [Paenibacillus konkukensis]UQZ86588.1 hypothetical protein SK3146_05881 [Paenibacillus konkukensis]
MTKHRKSFFAAALLMSLIITSHGLAYAQEKLVPFSDVSEDFWGYSGIEWAVKQQIAEGYPDGTFKPNAAIDENEFIAMLLRAYHPADLAKSTEGPGWAAPYTDYAKKLGWTIAAASGEAGFERGKAAQLAANAAGRNYSVDDAVQYMLDQGIAEGKTDGTPAGFRPSDPLTRAESALLIHRLTSRFDRLQPVPAAQEAYGGVLGDTVLYENKAHGFTLRIPKSWDGKYEVKERQVPNGTNIEFINKKTVLGTLFTVSVWSEKAWEADGEEIQGLIPITKLGEKSGFVYLFNTPTDVPYDPNDQQARADYLKMSVDVPSIKKTFVLLPE